MSSGLPMNMYNVPNNVMAPVRTPGFVAATAFFMFVIKNVTLILKHACNINTTFAYLLENFAPSTFVTYAQPNSTRALHSNANVSC